MAAGFNQFKRDDALRLAKGVAGQQDVFNGLSWGTPGNPSGEYFLHIVFP